jgi:mono/diheme cytochrome c family protein
MSMRTVVPAVTLAAALWAGLPGAAGAQTSAVERGNAKFQHNCAPCHGPGGGDDGRAHLPGTEALLIKYKGELPAVLEERKDLNYDALRVFVRRGTWSMPPFRKTEVTDADIEDIAAYLVESSKRAGAAPRR